MGVSKSWPSYSIQQQVISGETDRYLAAKSVCASRKFGAIYFPISTWTEVWVGLRTRFMLDYLWPTGQNYIEGEGACVFGLCSMSSPGIFGGAPNAVEAWSGKHALGLRMQAIASYNWASTISGGGKFYIAAQASPMKIENNVATMATGASANYPSDPMGRSLILVRMVNAGGTITMHILTGIGDAMGADVLSSALADAMTKVNWAAVKASLPTFAEVSPVGTVTIDESVNGVLDGFFFSHPRHYDGFQLCDVAVRGF